MAGLLLDIIATEPVPVLGDEGDGFIVAGEGKMFSVDEASWTMEADNKIKADKARSGEDLSPCKTNVARGDPPAVNIRNL